MRPELVGDRRLRFPIELYPDESVPSAVARAARQHVLVRTASVLEAAGLSMKHAGYSQLATPDEITRLSRVIRCSADELVNRAGVRVIAPDSSRAMNARFGRLILPRVHLELDRRRIAPLTLHECGYHKLSWLNLLLPYCDVSFERMVSSCAGCGATLGWRQARGISYCDSCGTEVAPSTEDKLPTAFQHDYKLFAQLSSLHHDTINAAIARLAKPLQTTSPGVLVKLALQVGSIVKGEALACASRREVATLARPLLASIAVTGVKLLQTWPDGIKSWVSTKSEELRDSPVELVALRHDLKSLVDTRRHSQEFIAVLSEALPELQKRAAHGLSGGRRYYLYGEVGRRLGLDAPDMDKLRHWMGGKYLQCREAHGKKYGQFDADVIDELTSRFRNTIPFNSCANSLKLPLYAIEQCCQDGLLKWENHSAVINIRRWHDVRIETFQHLCERLLQAACTSELPSNCVSLRVAAKRLGGRLKPWAAIVRSLIEGTLRFWLRDEQLNSTSIFVNPDDLAAFDRALIYLLDSDLRPSGTLSQLDAAEVLNIKPALLPLWSADLDLTFSRLGHGFVVPLNPVLDRARRTAWNAEISWHLGVKHHQVDRILDARSVERSSTGWSRAHLIKVGILPAGPVTNPLLGFH